MPAHSNFNDALAGVTAFNDAIAEGRKTKQSSRSKSHKKEKSKKDKKQKDSKRHSKSKESKKKRKRKSSSSDDDSESEEESLELQLQRGRSAVRLTREIMFVIPNAKASLHQMFWNLDHQEAVNIAAIPNEKLKSLLEALFTCLKLLKAGPGVFLKPKRGVSILSQLGGVLDEPVSERPAREEPAVQTSMPSMPSSAHVSDSPSRPVTPEAEQVDQGGSGGEGKDLGNGVAEERPSETEDKGVSFDVMPEPKARVLGPIMPPRELLDQAAEVAEAMKAEEAADMIGPPPPDVILETDQIPDDERSAEVVRIMRGIQASKQAKRPLDPYELVGVARDAPANVIKKRYWKLSLMIHPDKCSHPNADDAFKALSQAAKDLQDIQKRLEVDQGLEKAELDAFTEEKLKADEVARQWRVARGEATSEDLQGPIQVGGPKREEWITVLPANRRPKGASQKNQTSFSQQAVAAVNQDNSAWADTPQEKLLRLQQAGTAMLEAAEYDQAAKAKAEAVDNFNEAHRSQTLLEKHKHKQKKEKKKAKKDDGSTKEDWEGSLPWRPFDREKDLEVSTRPRNQKEFLSKVGDLSGRFGSSANASGGPRKFL